MRLLLSLVVVIVIAGSATPAIAQAIVGAGTPLLVAQAAPCDPAPDSLAPCYNAPMPTPAPTPVGVTSPATSIPQGTFARISTGMLTYVEKSISGAINASVYFGQRLFMIVAALSFVLALPGLVLRGDSIASIVRFTYWRVFEATVWLTLIAWTWTGPAGLPGWFPAIVGGIASIGSAIAQQAAGAPIASFSGDQFDLTVMPGNILDLGAGLFAAIWNAGWTTFAAASTGPSTPNAGPFVNGAMHAIVAIGSALSGAMFVEGIVFLVMAVSGIYAYFVCAWIAWRYFLAVLRILILACLSFLQGFAGSRRFSGYAGGFISIAIVMGSEFALVTIIVGVFYGIVMSIVKQTPLWTDVAYLTALTSMPAISLPYAGAAVSIGTCLLLDIVITFWALAMWDIPQKVSDFFSGRLTVNEHASMQAFQRSPMMGGKLFGAGVGLVHKGAHEGPVAVGVHVAKRAGIGALAKSMTRTATKALEAAGVDVEAAAAGAARGAQVGGVPGAVVGAVVGSAMAAKRESGEDEKETAQRERGEHAAHTGERESHASSGSQEAAAQTVSPVMHVESGTIPTPETPGDAEVERSVTISDHFTETGSESAGTAPPGEQTLRNNGDATGGSGATSAPGSSSDEKAGRGAGTTSSDSSRYRTDGGLPSWATQAVAEWQAWRDGGQAAAAASTKTEQRRTREWQATAQASRQWDAMPKPWIRHESASAKPTHVHFEQ